MVTLDFGCHGDQILTDWCGDSWFRQTGWCGDSWFRQTGWCGDSWFRQTGWCGDSWFRLTGWCGDSWFRLTGWCGDSWFRLTGWCDSWFRLTGWCDLWFRLTGWWDDQLAGLTDRLMVCMLTGSHGPGGEAETAVCRNATWQRTHHHLVSCSLHLVHSLQLVS